MLVEGIREGEVPVRNSATHVKSRSVNGGTAETFRPYDLLGTNPRSRLKSLGGPRK